MSRLEGKSGGVVANKSGAISRGIDPKTFLVYPKSLG